MDITQFLGQLCHVWLCIDYDMISLVLEIQPLLGFKKSLCIYLWFEIGKRLSQKAVAIWPVTGQAKLPASPIFF